MTDESPRLVMSRGVRLVDGKGALLVAPPRGTVLELEGDSAGVVRAVLAFLRSPHDVGEVVEHIAAIADDSFDPAVIHDLLGVLANAGVIVAAPAAPEAAKVLLGSRVVLCVSGAIQAVEAPRMVRELQRLGCEVEVATTEAALRFVSETALAALTHRPVRTTLWSGDPSHPVPHVELAQWADLVLVYPASATTISRIATGDCSDLVAALAITTRAPVVLVPSMNAAMFESAPVARNLEALLGDGFIVVSPGFGVEVADRPGARTDRHGPALGPPEIATLVPLLIEKHGRPRPVDWDAMYSSEAPLPFEPKGLEGELAAALAESPPPRSLLDVGTGTGTIAIAAAALGYRVVGVDRSETALGLARAKPGAERVVFSCDDVRRTRLRSTFDVLINRGSLHTAEADNLLDYAHALARLAAPAARLLVVHDGPDASPERRTLRIEPAELAQVLGVFRLIRYERTTLVTTDPGASWLSVFERTDDPGRQ